MGLKALAKKVKTTRPSVPAQPVLTQKEQKEITKRNAIVEQYLPYASSIASRVTTVARYAGGALAE